MKNSGDNVFWSISVDPDEARLFNQFLNAQDLAENSRKAMTQDIRNFARWFTEANNERFSVGRVTTRDITDCRNHLRREKQQAVSTVNRALVTIRRFFGSLADEGHVTANPAKPVKELRRQQLAPKGLERSQVRKLLREIELRQDVRANAVFSLLLYTGCRVGDLVALELNDMTIGERSGSVVFRLGKGTKQRTVPLPVPARQAIQAYLNSRPPITSQQVFVGERGPLTDRGIRAMCNKYSALIGVKIHPHLLRHTMAHQFLADNENDLVGLAQILGHETITTTARYAQRNHDQLAGAVDRVTY